jgi:hypothetical protein
MTSSLRLKLLSVVVEIHVSDGFDLGDIPKQDG